MTLILHGYIATQINSVQNHLRNSIHFKNIMREFNIITIIPIYLLFVITISFIVLILHLIFLYYIKYCLSFYFTTRQNIFNTYSIIP